MTCTPFLPHPLPGSLTSTHFFWGTRIWRCTKCMVRHTTSWYYNLDATNLYEWSARCGVMSWKEWALYSTCVNSTSPIWTNWLFEKSDTQIQAAYVLGLHWLIRSFLASNLAKCTRGGRYGRYMWRLCTIVLRCSEQSQTLMSFNGVIWRLYCVLESIPYDGLAWIQPVSIRLIKRQ